VGGEVEVLKKRPSPTYSYWEKGRNRFLYSDLNSLKKKKE
jgi:hypothetical protein